MFVIRRRSQPLPSASILLVSVTNNLKLSHLGFRAGNPFAPCKPGLTGIYCTLCADESERVYYDKASPAKTNLSDAHSLEVNLRPMIALILSVLRLGGHCMQAVRRRGPG